jgi:hypothetical protein
MIITINTASQFREVFINAGRRNDFSYDGLGMLFDYFETCDPMMEVDVIDICCEYEECSFLEYCENYNIDIKGFNDANIKKTAIEHIEYNSVLIGVTDFGNVIYANH